MLKLWNVNMRMLLLLWLCFVLRGAFYAILFPLWEGYDEYAHFGFLQQVVTVGALPTTSTPLSREVEESLKLAPLPWTLRFLEPPHLIHDGYWKLPEEDRIRRQRELYSLPREWAQQPAGGNLRNWEAQQPPLYYWIFSVPLRWAWNAPLPGRVVLLRLLSVLLASLAVPLGYLISRRVLQSCNSALGVVALVTAMPELMVDICRVGNESLAILFYSLLMYAVFRFAENPGRPALAAFMGTCLGLGLLTKAYFLTAVPAIVAVVLYCHWSAAASRRKVLIGGLLALAAAVLISGWWYWRNLAMSGSWSGVMTDVALSKMPKWELARQVPKVDWKNGLDTLLISHVWFGNWSFLQVKSWIYYAFRDAALVSMIGIAVIAVLPRLKRGLQFPFLSSRKNLMILVAIYGFFWLGLLYHVLTTFVAQGSSSSQGWYLYCLVIAEVLIVISGLLALTPGFLRCLVLPAAIASFTLLDLYTVHFLFLPYYAGLISHKADGALAAFHVMQLKGLASWNILGRLTANKPLHGSAAFLVIWALYLTSTILLATTSFLLARRTE